MKKQLSIKELVLFVILFVLLLFLYISRGPLTNKSLELEEERFEIQTQIDDLQPVITQMDGWQTALDKVYAKYSGNPKSIPDFNNINSVINEMGMIFDGDSTYSITFGDPIVNDHIVTRNLQITFSCYKYDEMISKLVTINSSDNKYRITDLNIAKDSTDLYSVSLGLIAYEYTSEE